MEQKLVQLTDYSGVLLPMGEILSPQEWEVFNRINWNAPLEFPLLSRNIASNRSTLVHDLGRAEGPFLARSFGSSLLLGWSLNVRYSEEPRNKIDAIRPEARQGSKVEVVPTKWAARLALGQVLPRLLDAMYRVQYRGSWLGFVAPDVLSPVDRPAPRHIRGECEGSFRFPIFFEVEPDFIEELAFGGPRTQRGLQSRYCSLVQQWAGPWISSSMLSAVQFLLDYGADELNHGGGDVESIRRVISTWNGRF